MIGRVWISALILLGVTSSAMAYEIRLTDMSPASDDGDVSFTLFETEADHGSEIATVAYCQSCRSGGCVGEGKCPFTFLGISQDGMANFVDNALPDSNIPFPMLESLVEGSGMTLPPPLGLSAVFTELNRTVAVSDVRLAVGAGTPTSVNRVNVPTSKFHASSQMARVDLWVLPFVNIYGLAGYTRSTGSVDVTVSGFPTMMSPDGTINVPVDLEGPTGGFGVTTGIGGKKWFAMLDVNKTWTNFSQVDSSLTALVITPRIGMPIDRPCFKGEVHIGAMWQDTDQTVGLTFDHAVLGNDLVVEVDQFEPRPWNFLIGGLWAIDEQMQVLLEIGSGGRNYVVSGVTIRF